MGATMKPPSRLRDLRLRLEYAAVRTITDLARLLPLRLAVRWSATLWRIFAPRLNPKRHRIALENLRIAFPEKSGSERLAICLAHWENLGRVIAETVQIDRVLSDPSRIEIPDQHLLARYRNKLGPAIGVSLHMGNWELAIWPLVVAGANPAALYRAIDNPYVDRYLRAKRRTLYPAGLIGRRSADSRSPGGPADGPSPHGPRARRRAGRDRLRPVLQARHSSAVLRPNDARPAYRRHHSAPHRRPGVDGALPAHRHRQPFQDRDQGASGAPNGQSGRRRAVGSR